VILRVVQEHFIELMERSSRITGIFLRMVQILGSILRRVIHFIIMSEVQGGLIETVKVMPCTWATDKKNLVVI
jgi:hypothetical protein